jgi:general secretion pathway protein I
MRKVGGFTLLEVLVALVIVALGLMAAFGQVNQSLTTASLLRDKTLAHWIAVDQVTRLRVLGQFPAIGSTSDEIEMARTRWIYRTKVTKTDFADLRQVDVTVAFSDRPDNVLASVTGIVGKAQAKPAATGSDWPAIEPKE